MGATDVLPLIPIAGVTLAECAELARALAGVTPTNCASRPIATRLRPLRPNGKTSPCAAPGSTRPCRKLAHTASGARFRGAALDETARTGATTVGARDFLIAVNFNLNCTSTRRANAIAFDVREKGRPSARATRSRGGS